MISDHVTNMALRIPAVIAAGVQVLAYSGDLDYICNWMGGQAWTKNMDWPGKESFNAATATDWMVKTEKAGTFWNYKNFTFLRFFGAGHQVPQDKPMQALAMLEQFINGQLPPPAPSTEEEDFALLQE